MNSCERCQELISALIDGEISREEHAALTEHLKSCSSCRAMYEVFRGLSDSLSETPAELPAGLHENIMAGVRRSAMMKKNRRLRSFGLRLAVSAAACAVLVLFGASGYGRGLLGSRVGVRSEELAQTESAPAPAPTAGAEPFTASGQDAVPAPVGTAAPAPTPAPVWTVPPTPAPRPATPDPYLAAQQEPQPSQDWQQSAPGEYYAAQKPASDYEYPAQDYGYAGPEYAVEEPAANDGGIVFAQNAAPKDDAPGEAEGGANAFLLDEGGAEAAGPDVTGEDGGKAEDGVFFGEPEETVDFFEEKGAPEAEPEEAPAAARGTVEEYCSVVGLEARYELLFLLNGNHMSFPEQTPTRRILVDLLPDEEGGGTERMEIRIYGDYVFFSYFPQGGESGTFWANCTAEKLDGWLGAHRAAANSASDPAAE